MCCAQAAEEHVRMYGVVPGTKDHSYKKIKVNSWAGVELSDEGQDEFLYYRNERENEEKEERTDRCS